jgi:hypothetical protein
MTNGLLNIRGFGLGYGGRIVAAAIAISMASACDNAGKAEPVSAPAAAPTPAATTNSVEVAAAPSANAITMSASMPHEAGFAYTYSLPFDPSVRKLRLFEDGKELGPADAIHEEIRTKGMGRFSQWPSAGGSTLYFSASDNSDPNTNGRHYELR